MAQDIATRDGLAWGEGVTGARMMLRDGGSLPWTALQHALPLSDIAVFARSSESGAAMNEGPLAEALMAARAPVLIARDSNFPTGGSVAIAWDGSLEAGRAVRAARPLLVEAEEIVILQDPTELSEDNVDAAAPERLTAYLRLCGCVTFKSATVAGGNQGHALIAAANHHKAKLLIAGAYGHPRVSEWVLGGATRAFLDAKDAPHLLLAH